MAKALKDMLDFTGKTAIITGSGSGMGVGIANRFSETGANVVFTYFREQSKKTAERCVAEIEAAGRKAMAVQFDVRNPEDSKRLVSEVVEHFGRIDMLVNNAGIYPHHDLLTVGEKEWDEMHDSNLKGAFFCSQAVANQMIAQKSGGSIVNIISINAYRPMINGLVYGASKAGLGMVTTCMAVELGKYGIRVNGVAPGLIDAPGLDENVPGWREAYSERAACGRIGTPTDIADACIFYCSELSSWITGEITMVDGGIMHAKAY